MTSQLPVVQPAGNLSAFARRLNEIRARIRSAEEKAGRAAGSVRLVASTRTLMADPVIEAAETGVKDFCEEYLPEGVTKRPVVDHRVEGLTWHFAGTLLSKKIHLAVEFFDWIHSFDKPTLIRSFAEAVRSKSRTGIRVLIEVNPLGPKKRGGLSPSELPAMIGMLRDVEGAVLSGLSFKSELSVFPGDSAAAYPEMAALHRKLLADGVLPPEATELAMGTSRDFEEAVRHGATIVRIGSALFSAPSGR